MLNKGVSRRQLLDSELIAYTFIYFQLGFSVPYIYITVELRWFRQLMFDKVTHIFTTVATILVRVYLIVNGVGWRDHLI
jgi:hypothetical protein